jgi:predicted RNase H-like nuclease (RuvC/YqgF family)
MSLQVTRQPFKLPPALNALAVVAQSSHDLLLEVEKTKEVYEHHVKESQETITAQAQENQKLKAELESLKEMHARELVALRGAHAAEIARYVTAMKVDAGRIAELARRVDQEAASVQKLRSALATQLSLRHPFGNDEQKIWDQARALLQ